MEGGAILEVGRSVDILTDIVTCDHIDHVLVYLYCTHMIMNCETRNIGWKNLPCKSRFPVGEERVSNKRALGGVVRGMRSHSDIKQILTVTDTDLKYSKNILLHIDIFLF